MTNADAADRIEFARALELVCRHLNPPHHPLPAAISLADLGLDGLVLRSDDALLAYRYHRGLELPGPDAAAPAAAGRLWSWQGGLNAAASALAELRPGIVACGDVVGAVRLFTHGARGRWECIATLNAHAGAVTVLLPLGEGALLSASADGGIAIVRQDGQGAWRIEGLRGSDIWGHGARRCACRLADGTALVGGPGGVTELQATSSGEWESRGHRGAAPVIALAPYGAGWFELRPDSAPWFCQRQGGTVSGDFVGWPAGPATDVVPWGSDGGLAFATERGEVLRLRPHDPANPSPIDPAAIGTPQRLSPSPIRRLWAMGTAGLATWSDGGALRLWRTGEREFQRVAEYAGAETEPSAAALCDGRWIFGDRRGVALAAPDHRGLWRVERALAALETGIVAVAGLGADRTAYVQGGRTLVIALLKADDLEIEYIGELRAPVHQLAALPGPTLVVAMHDGTVDLWRRDSAGAAWLARPLPTPPGRGGGPSADDAPRVAAGGDWLFCAARETSADALSLGLFLRAPDGEMKSSALPPLPPAAAEAPCVAVAVTPRGRCALATTQGLWQMAGDSWVPVDGRPAPVGLHWLGEDDLLVLHDDNMSARLIAGQWQGGPFGVGPNGRAPRIAVLAGRVKDPAQEWAAAALVVSVGATGLQWFGLASPLPPGALPFIDAVRGGVNAVAAGELALLVGTDALHVFRVSPAGFDAGRLQRFIVDDEAVACCRLDPDGRIRRLTLRRRGGATWNVRNVGGRALPDDPVLDARVALLDPQGTLVPISAGANFSFNAERTVFTAEDPG